MSKTIGIIGLGKMGFGMSERLLKSKLKVVAYNRSPEKTRQLSKKGAIPSYDLRELLEKLPGKKIVWLMLPAGPPTENIIKNLVKLMKKGDIIINGANDFYKNAERQNILCKKKEIHFFDCGVSGGILGKEKGYTLMVGGEKSQFKNIEPFCKALSQKKGYGYFGPVGSGHFIKSVHNIIEYTYLQGLAEGIELLNKKSPKIDIKKVTEVWKSSSIIQSLLLNLTNKAISNKDFKKIGTEISSVTTEELVKTKNSVKGYAPAFDSAVKIRKDKNKSKFSLGKRTISAVRNEFGGHKISKK